jgi:hypothetical protein
VRNASIIFPDMGTIAMQGPRGSGKTSLGEAVSRAVFGIPQKALGKMSFKRRGNTYVCVEGTLGDKPFTVETGYKCEELGGTGEGLRFTVDGIPTQRADIKDTRSELNAVLGISQELTMWTVFLNGDKLDFGELSQATQVELLMQALQQPPWPSYLVEARRKLDEVHDEEVGMKGELDAVRNSLITAENAVSLAAEDVETALLRYTSVETEYNRQHATHDAEMKRLESVYRSAVEARKKARQELAEVTETAGEKALKEHQEVLKKAEKTYADAQVLARKLAAKLAADNSECQRQRREYGKFTKRPTNCPTCGQKWPADEHLEAEKARAYDALSKAVEISQTSQTLLEDAERKETEADDAVHAIMDKIARRVGELTRAASEKAEKADDAEEYAEKEAVNWEDQAPQKPDDTNLKQARSALEAEKNLVQRTKTQLEATGLAYAAIERQVLLRKYWVEALGPAGIPNQIIRQALPPLNTAAASASVALTGGEITVSFATTRELATGEERNKLTVHSDNPRGADELSEFSKGEGGIHNLIISESLSMIGQLPQRCAWRWLDEVINNQDRKHVYGYYRRLAHTNRMTIFIVDHHPDALALADHVLVATKDEAGFTSYSWQT